MRRALSALLLSAILLPAAVALAHDPLDDVSGEEEFTQKPDDDDRPESHRKQRQEAEMAKELQERDDTEFQLNQEKDEFLRDRAETNDVLAGERRRNELAGAGGARPHHDAPPPRRTPSKSEEAKPSKTRDPNAPTRGDVDPTDPGDK